MTRVNQQFSDCFDSPFVHDNCPDFKSRNNPTRHGVHKQYSIYNTVNNIINIEVKLYILK